MASTGRPPARGWSASPPVPTGASETGPQPLLERLKLGFQVFQAGLVLGFQLFQASIWGGVRVGVGVTGLCCLRGEGIGLPGLCCVIWPFPGVGLIRAARACPGGGRLGSCDAAGLVSGSGCGTGASSRVPQAACPPRGPTVHSRSTRPGCRVTTASRTDRPSGGHGELPMAARAITRCDYGPPLSCGGGAQVPLGAASGRSVFPADKAHNGMFGTIVRRIGSPPSSPDPAWNPAGPGERDRSSGRPRPGRTSPHGLPVASAGAAGPAFRGPRPRRAVGELR